nr:hypothetical protein [Tanacetum cinerariifolium]
MSDFEHSLVIYTSVPSPVEDYSDIGSPEVDGPPSPDYVPGSEEPEQAPLTLDYVSGPEEPEQAPPLPIYLPYVPELVYPEYMPPEDDVFPAEEQPLPVAVTPTAESPGYILEFDPKGNLEEDDEEDPEEDPADYPADSTVVALPAVDHIPSEEELLESLPYSCNVLTILVHQSLHLCLLANQIALLVVEHLSQLVCTQEPEFELVVGDEESEELEEEFEEEEEEEDLEHFNTFPTIEELGELSRLLHSELRPASTVETILNMSLKNKAHLESEKNVIHLILTGIGDEIYSAIDACKATHEMWEDIERLQQGESLNIQDVKTNLFWVFGKHLSRWRNNRVILHRVLQVDE